MHRSNTLSPLVFALQQGLQYVAALHEQPHRPEVTCLEYPGEGHSLAGTEAQAHAVQSVVSFLTAHLKKPDAAAEEATTEVQ